MRKFFLILVFQFYFVFPQNIGVVRNFDPNLKHIHLKGMWNYHPEKVEDLDYDLSPFIDSLFIERNIKYSEYNDFDFEIFLKPNTTKRIEKKLYEYCKEKNLDAIIILLEGNYYHSLDPLKGMHGMYSYAILTHKNSKKYIQYANRISPIYYTMKSKVVKYPLESRKNGMSFPLKAFKIGKQAFDEETNTLLDREEQKKLFLDDFHRRIRINFQRIFDDIL